MKSSEISKLDKHRGRHFAIGLIVSISFVLAAFNYTTFPGEEVPYEMPDFEEEDEVEIIRTPTNEKKVVLPPKVEITEKFDIQKDMEIMEEILPEPIENVLDETIVETKEPEYISAPKPKPQPKPAPPVIKPPEIIEDTKEYIFVEHMPRFPGCEDKDLLTAEKKTCAEKAMLEFIYKNIKYPKIALENGIKGTVVVSFVIDKTGQPTDFKIVRDIGGGCGKEAIRVAKKMPKWRPGIQQGKKVKVRYNLPIRYEAL